MGSVQDVIAHLKTERFAFGVNVASGPSVAKHVADLDDQFHELVHKHLLFAHGRQAVLEAIHDLVAEAIEMREKEPKIDIREFRSVDAAIFSLIYALQQAAPKMAVMAAALVRCRPDVMPSLFWTSYLVRIDFSKDVPR